MMKKLLFVLSFLGVFVISCVDDSDSFEEENSGSSADLTDSADRADDADTADSGIDTEQADSEINTEPEVPADQTGDAEPSESAETPDEDHDVPGQSEEPATEKFCLFACTKASDCVQSGSNEANNYDCIDRKCVYFGCKSDAECGENYYCNENGAYGYPECTPKCTTAADCASGTSTESAFDSDNYKCEDSRCVYTGCNSDAECQSGGIAMRCVPEKYGERTRNTCFQSCSTPADCANAVYPEELYSCTDQVCRMKSCESDEWCAKYVNPKFSCL